MINLKECVELIQQRLDEIQPEDGQRAGHGMEPCMCPLHSSGPLHLIVARKVCQQDWVLQQDAGHSSLE